jgi:hypothetical protein
MYFDYPEQSTQKQVYTIQVKAPRQRNFRDISNGQLTFEKGSEFTNEHIGKVINELALKPEHVGHTFRIHEHTLNKTPRMYLDPTMPGVTSTQDYPTLGEGTEVPGTTVHANDVQKEAATIKAAADAQAEVERQKQEASDHHSMLVRAGIQRSRMLRDNPELAKTAAANASRRQAVEAAMAARTKPGKPDAGSAAPKRGPGRPPKPDSPAAIRAAVGVTQTAAEKRRERANKSGKARGK